jgi:glutamate-1-semialdehyde 2,1-aminomutase
VTETTGLGPWVGTALVTGGLVTAGLVTAGRSRLKLSRAKHPSLAGHARWSKRLAKLVPFYEFGEERFFDSDGAPAAVVAERRAGFERLARQLNALAPRTIAATDRLEPGVSDLQFTRAYRVPFQYSRYVAASIKLGGIAHASSGVTFTDLDGNVAYDLTGSYGVNVFGYDFYKACVDAGLERARALGPVLGLYHPLIEDNVRALQQISGLDEVSFHMSGTEAVMQAVRLARYHTGRSHVVQFCGAYHGWWDGVQPGVGSVRTVRDVYMLKEMDPDTLDVLRTRSDVACVLVNPLQALHPNTSAPGDAALIADRHAGFDREAYTNWLRELRAVCSDRGIVLIFDEVFVGFRLARGGAQEYFGVAADMVTYGKTLGGGLPVGVVCGRHRFMKRYRDDRPTDVCFARGTFNSHPYVMGAMHEFLRRLDEPARLDQPALRDSYATVDKLWNDRFATLNARLAAEQAPVRIANLASICTVCYTAPSRYHWMLQFYLRAQGLALSWIGSGRLIFSHNYSDADFAVVADRFVAAVRAMREDGWWRTPAGLTSKAINRQVLREMLAVRLPWLIRR